MMKFLTPSRRQSEHFTLCNDKEFGTWKIAKTETGSVAEMRAPNMTLSWNGSLYIRKNKPPKYLQRYTSLTT